MNELALFAGAGGGLLASKLLGWRTVGAVEIDPYCRRVLLERQRDGALEKFPIWDDIRTFDGKPWRGVDVISGGFPCQDVSSAGRGRGLAGERSGLWFEMLRVIGEARPRFVFAENSPHLRTRGLGTIVEGLASLGYDARWCVLGARHVGANHRRDRLWILAHPHNAGERVFPKHAEVGGASADAPATSRDASDANGETLRLQPGGGVGARGQEAPKSRDAGWWSKPRFAGVDDGVADRMERVRATGNGQVPVVAATAWRILGGG